MADEKTGGLLGERDRVINEGTDIGFLADEFFPELWREVDGPFQPPASVG